MFADKEMRFFLMDASIILLMQPHVQLHSPQLLQIQSANSDNGNKRLLIQCQWLFPSLTFCIIYSHVHYARHLRDVEWHHRNMDVLNITLHVLVLGIRREQEVAWGLEGCSCLEVGCGW